MTNIVLFFILGLAVGSFLNVLIDRIPSGESIWKGRSHCDYCRHILSWHDLIPVFSFFLLSRRCRYCYKKLSWQYPLVELVTGILFAFVYIRIQVLLCHPGLRAGIQSLIVWIPGQARNDILCDIIPYSYFLSFIFYLLVIISGLITIFFTDLKYRIIPDQVLILLTAVTLIYLFLFQRIVLLDHLLAALILFFFFVILTVITRGKGMGLGDVKYVFVMGLILGTKISLVSFYLSFLTGAVFSSILVIQGKKKMKSTIPFGPFLAGSTAISLFYGDFLWNIFRRIIGI